MFPFLCKTIMTDVLRKLAPLLAFASVTCCAMVSCSSCRHLFPQMLQTHAALEITALIQNLVYASYSSERSISM